MTARHRFSLALLALLAVLMVGATGYMVIEAERGVGFRDAVYMTVITLSTVGYGEPWELSGSARMWTIGVITFGIVTVSYAFGSLVSLVVSGELRSVREQQKMQKSLHALHDHVILCGFGRMGALAAEELRQRGVALAVIDRDEKLQETMRELGSPFVLGDATEEETVVRAGLHKARALVTTLPSDADNVYITLTAHTLRPDLVVIARAEQPAAEAKLKRAGATRVVCPQATGAMKVANVLTRPTVVDFVELAGKGVDLEIDEYLIKSRSPLVGQTLRDAHVRHHTGAIAVAIKRADGEAIVNPDPDAVLSLGDTLILVGPGGVSSRLDEIDTANNGAG